MTTTYHFVRSAASRLPAAAALACALACSAKHPSAPSGANFVLSIGDRIAIAGTPLVLTFERLAEDSRCPPDVVCVWHGNAQLELVAQIGSDLRTVRLNTHVGPSEGVAGAFRITLVDFTPPPASNVEVTPAYYRATLVVTDTAGGACTEEARAGLSVSVTDSLLGPVVFTGLSVVVYEGAYRDSILQATYPGAPFEGPLGFAYERAGTYGIEIRADGYASWNRAGVVVERDECHVITVPVTARMTR
jgi:hypothetical protein